MLGKWEKAVCEINNSPGWKATGYTYICSKHFPQYENIILPSEDGTCRLKSTAVRALSSIHPVTQSMTSLKH